MREQVTYYIQKVVCWILLLQMVNISIEPPEILYTTRPNVTVKADHSIDKIESIYEFVSEGLLDTAVPDSEEQEIEKNSKSIQLFFCHPSLQDFAINKPLLQYQVYNLVKYALQYPDPVSPPPKKT